MFSIRQVPQLNDEEEITYYEIEKCYFSEIEAFENTNIVGISTEKYQRSDFQLFLDIFSYYKNVLFYALFFLNCIFYCYVDSNNKRVKLFSIIYMIIFLLVVSKLSPSCFQVVSKVCINERNVGWLLLIHHILYLIGHQ